MLEIIQETLIDSIKILPFLFLTYLLMEYIEHKMSDKIKNVIEKSGHAGPVVGGILGCFPQCGFSVSAANLYSARVITLGTLISIFLSTSDEMLPIFISNGTSIVVILRIIGIKILIGMAAGIIIDYIMRKKNKEIKEDIHDMCETEHCHCEESILKSALKHTLNIFVFIILISFIINIVMHLIGEETLATVLTGNTFLGPIIASLIGLIPNCVATVVITELYLSSSITLGGLIAGTLSSAGVGLAVLFKVNKNLKENLKIVGLMYFIGVFAGIIINFINL